MIKNGTSPTNLAGKVLPLDISWPHLAVGVCGSWPVIWTWRGWVVIHQAWKKSIPGEFLRKHMWTNKSIVEYLKAAGDIMWYDSYAGISIRNPIPSFNLLLHIPNCAKESNPVWWDEVLASIYEGLWHSSVEVLFFHVARGMVFFFVGWIFPWWSLAARHWIELLLGSGASALKSAPQDVYASEMKWMKQN